MARTTKVAKPVIYRHTSHAEWGLGMIVEETSAKVYLAFENGGRRPFLNVPQFRAQLLPVELAADAAEEAVAKIARKAPKPPAKVPAKKARQRVAEEDHEAAEPDEAGERDEQDGDE